MIDYTKCVGPGWAHIVQPLVDYCTTHGLKIFQVKETVGGLLFYADFNEKLDKLIEAAEVLADETCETCGEPGRLRGDRPWLKTLCDTHAEEER